MRVWCVLLALCFVAQGWAQPDQPALHVSTADNKLVVRVHAPRMAAWRPSADGLMVVVPQGGDVQLDTLPTGVTAEKVASNGLQGVFVRGVASTWKVVKDGDDWLVRPGNGLQSESVLMLRDGWYTDKETLKPQAFKALGKDWQVALVTRPLSVVGSVVGAVRVADETTLAEISPAAGEQEVPAHEAKVAATKTPDAPTEPETVKRDLQGASVAEVMARSGPHEEPEAAQLPTLPAKPRAVAEATRQESGLAKVAVHPADSMKALPLHDVQSEMLPRLLGTVYTPGTLVSLTFPEGMTGLGVPLPSEKKSNDAEHVAVNAEDTHGAPTEVVKPLDEQAVVAEATSATEVRGTWNQVTLEPARRAMEEQKQQQEEKAHARAGELAPAPKPDMAHVEPAQDVPPETVKRLLPLRGDHYVEDIQAAQLAVAETPADSPREREAQLYMAGLYLVWYRPQEAMAVLGELPERADGLPASPMARLLMGVATLAREDSPAPKLFDQGGALAPHAALWRAVAASRNGDYTTALKIWPTERGILPQYPAYLREMAQEAQVTALVMVGDRNVAKHIIDQLVEGYADEDAVPATLNRMRGLVRLGTPEESAGLEYLAKAAEDTRDPVTAYRAKFEFVRALYQRRDLSEDQVRAYLTDLWFDWRGDELEQDVLTMLGDLYEKAGDSRLALYYWQTLVRAYPRATNLKQVTERMGDAFVHVFDPENPHVYDPLEYIGLYYDFSELVPNNARGDLIHEQVARLLIDANLWDRAVPILEQQLKFRPLDAATQGRLSLMLADAYAHMGKAAEGIKIIDKWQHAAKTQVLAREWKLVEADLLLRLKRPKAVLKALDDMPKDDDKVNDLRIEAAWMDTDWPLVIRLLEERLAAVAPTTLASSKAAQLAALRLGYAYGQVRDADKLDALKSRFGSVMNRTPNLADGLGAVAAGTGISATAVADGPLAPLTTALSDINRLTDNIQLRREALAQQREEQQEYNDKMRYMELLPPPAI